MYVTFDTLCIGVYVKVCDSFVASVVPVGIFPSSQTHDFVVLDSIGREVWRWAGDRMFTSAMQTKMLSARETMKVQENWDPAGKKGKFTVVAKLTSGNHPLEEKAEFHAAVVRRLPRKREKGAYRTRPLYFSWASGSFSPDVGRSTR